MSIKDKVVAEGMKLAASPQVAKLMQDERVMKLVMTAVSMPGKVQSFTAEQKEAFPRSMGRAPQDEVKELKRQITALDREINDLRARR